MIDGISKGIDSNVKKRSGMKADRDGMDEGISGMLQARDGISSGIKGISTGIREMKKKRNNMIAYAYAI